jgi:septal ring factor EnvC (AmiA/AmiB activator)
MSRARLLRIFVVAAMVAAVGGLSAGCTKKPSKDELSKLDESKSAAESAEKKLYELKQERMRLETELQQKQEELKKSEEERDDIKKKVGK